jgi:hypothetical protein
VRNVEVLASWGFVRFSSWEMEKGVDFDWLLCALMEIWDWSLWMGLV